MFTVIIAEENFLKMFDEFEIFLKPMMHQDAYALCPWYKEEKNIEEMLPDLYEIVQHHDEWRAIVIDQDGMRQLNPFDYVQHRDPKRRKSNTFDWEGVAARRAARFESYSKAISNPFTRLTSALCGIPAFKSVVADETTYENIVSGQLPLYRYMLSLQLNALDLFETGNILAKHKKNALKRFVPEDKINDLIDSVASGAVDRILALVPVESIVDLISLIGDNDPLYSDPESAERMVENTYKAKLFSGIEDHFTLHDKLPTEVICLSPRIFDYDSHEQQIKWQEKDELEYSSFYQYNLYSEKLKYLVFDVIEKEHHQYKFDRMRMICFLLLVAENTFPFGSVAPKRVYRVNIEFNTETVRKLCTAYISKLKATDVYIRKVNEAMVTKDKMPIDNETSRKLFESEITVPVAIEDNFDTDKLYAKYDSIGLSKDCPTDEYNFWHRQITEIIKLFGRYLREPRRALQTAVENDFKEENAIDDERINLLTKRQIEDVDYHLLDEEEKMLAETTPRIFKTKEYLKQINKADREVRNGIFKRMTKKKTVLTALIAIAVYFFGFTPLLLKNIKNVKTFFASLSVTGIAIGVFLLIGLVFLFALRRKLINRFKHFNYVMSGILQEIENGMNAFSRYLSHACNVMRSFSVLHYKKRIRISRESIVKKHQYDVQHKIAEINELFYGFVDLSDIDIADVEPYDYDFTVMEEYHYDMPYDVYGSKIEFIQPGNVIEISADYVQDVTLTREELYD